jgi:hypothetical protein
MTNRVQGFIVTLEKDMREDDAKEVIRAIEMLRGVIRVKPVETDLLGQQVERDRLRVDIYNALHSVFEKKA